VHVLDSCKITKNFEAFRYFHPDDEGPLLNGARFVPVRVRALYASLEEESAPGEVPARKNTLGGRSQIALGKYSRGASIGSRERSSARLGRKEYLASQELAERCRR
jgi:hypothetical protein